MKRPIIIIVGIILVFLLLAIWVYILFSGGTSDNEDKFADLNFDNNIDPTTVIPEGQAPTNPIVDVTGVEKLKQLTTTPVIGFGEVQQTFNSTTEVYYIEPGTGYIFSINLSTGEERRVSGTTIPSANKGTVTGDGRFTMIKSGFGAGTQFSVGTISTTSDQVPFYLINEDVVDFTSTINNTFLYIARENGGVIGKELDPTTRTSKTLFTLPFNEVTMDWGNDSATTHYAYPRPNSKLEGYLYEIKQENVTRIPVSGYGLSARALAGSILYSSQTDGSYKTSYYNVSNSLTTQGTNDLMPEKCVVVGIRSVFICSIPESQLGSNVPDIWYEGATSFVDNIWEINPQSGAASFILDTKQESGREIDMINLKIGSQDTKIYFQNKNDQTLWLYDLSVEDNLI